MTLLRDAGNLLAMEFKPQQRFFLYPFLRQEHAFYGNDLFFKNETSVIEPFPVTFGTLAQKIVD